MVKWEYHIAYLTNMKRLTEDMNLYGAEGWDLVSVTPSSIHWMCVFKRPIP